MNWYKIAECVRSDRVVLDLCQVYESSQQDGLLPLHELITQQGSAIGTLIMFKKNAATLTPTSKIQFYSDANRVNLIAEINAGTEGRKDLPPLLLDHGKVWVSFDAGTNALLPRHK